MRKEDHRHQKSGAASGAGRLHAEFEPSGTRNRIVVGIGEMAVSSSPDDWIISYSLGSCLGVVIYDPEIGVGGMLHAMLPLAKLNAEHKRDQSCMFVDAGMTRLLESLFALGLRKARAIVKLVGAARVIDRADMFRIGERNYAVCRKILWKNNMMIAAEDVGGRDSRTIKLDMSSGRLWIRSQGVIREL